MKSDRINYIVVGVFVIAMMAGLIVAVALLTGRAASTESYYTRFHDATGLKFGSQVLYMGYPVGQVEAIDPVLENGRMSFRVTLAINEDFKHWNVPGDSTAEIKAAGLLAAVAIDIRAGESGDALEPGDTITGVSQVDVFTAVTDAANTLKFLTESSIKPLIENLHVYVKSFGAAFDERGNDLVTNLSILSRELAARSPELISTLIELSDEIKTSSSRLRTVLSEDNTDKVDSVVDNMVTASENVVSLTEDTRRQIQTLIGPDTSDKVDRALTSVSSASESFAALSEDVNRSLKQVLTPETGARIERALDNFSVAAAEIAGLSKDLSETRSELDRLLAALAAGVDENRPGLRGSVADLRYTLRSVAQHIDAVTYNLEGTSRNMHEFTRLLRQNPSILLRGASPEADEVGAAGTTP